MKFNLVPHSGLYMATPFSSAERDPPCCVPAMNDLNSFMARLLTNV